MRFTERTPFYLIATVFLFITIVLSLVSTFHIKNNGADFFPNKQEIKGVVYHDNTVIDKLCWYFSQFTHHTIFLLFTYFSMALAKLPYMGVGRNLAYTRSLFDSVNGFKSHYSITSGDDDLFIQETITKQNFAINLDPTSFCFSEGSTSWENWYMQKTRHFTTSGRYDVFKKAMLGIYPFTMLIFTISFVILMFDDNFRLLTLTGFGIVTLLKWWIQARCFLKLKEPSFIAFLPFYDLAYAISIPILYYTTDKKEIRKW